MVVHVIRDCSQQLNHSSFVIPVLETVNHGYVDFVGACANVHTVDGMGGTSSWPAPGLADAYWGVSKTPAR
jgi:hypothetical protein